MSKLYKIYKITNLTTNDGYVGYSKNPKDRIREHMNRYKSHGSSILRTAIKLFGEEHFVSAIVDTADTLEEAKRLKDKYIKRFRTEMPYGYNISGTKGYKWVASQTNKITGSNNKTSKLTEKQVVEILSDKRTQKEIAEEYEVSEATISKIKRGISWTHITRRHLEQK